MVRELMIRLVTNPLLIAVFIGTFCCSQSSAASENCGGWTRYFCQFSNRSCFIFARIIHGQTTHWEASRLAASAAFSFIILFVLPFLFMLILKPFPVYSLSKGWILEAAMPMGLTAYALLLEV